MRAAEHAPRCPFRLIERRHCLAEIVERCAVVSEESRDGLSPRATPPHLEREHILFSTACRDDICRDDCRTVVAPAFAAKNFRHLAGTEAKARWNATAADAPTEPTATHGAAAAKWDPRRVGYYRGRFQEETACLSRG